MSNNKVRKPNIVRGGIAVPLGRNYYYMRGRKHEQGGIDIGKNPRTGLEVEDGEVMHIGNKNVEVFSAQPFLNGKSPAQRVMSGENPNTVFNAQERFKKRNKINDDGTKKKAEWGMKEGSTADVITDMIPVVGTLKEATRLVRNPSWEQVGWTLASLASDVTGGLVGKALVKSAKAARAARAAGRAARNIHPNVAKGIGAGVMTTGDMFVNGIQQDINKKNKKSMGGLSRSKDYGSKSKPYPNVKKSDFAGDGRSYPIPTKADARDALRLAGLHHRPDVKAKVYRKYPELRKKAKAGGLYSLTVNGETTLHQFPSTGKVKKSKTTKSAGRSKFAKGGDTKDKDKVKVITANTLPEVNPFTFTENSPTTTPTENVEATTNTSVPRAFAKRNRDITDPKKLNIAYQKASGTYPNWFQRTYRNVKNYINEHPDTVNDSIGLASNVISSLIGNSINRRMLNSLRYSSAPIPQRTAKLKTRININPQLDRMRESLAAYERAIDTNTASSQIALARKQRARIANVLSTNELYGNKENAETSLINQDRLNQQEVANRNIDAYNAWAQGKTDFENSIRQQKAENNIALMNNLNAGVQNVINNIQQRRTEGRNIRAMLLAYPDLPAEQLLASGLITQNEYDTYRKGYPLKNRKKTNNNNNE